MRKRKINQIKRFDSQSLHDKLGKPIKKIDNIYIISKIGSGSFGKVYVGLDKDTGKYYAVKRLKYKDINRHAGGISSLEREIRMLKTFDNPNILKLYKIYKCETEPFLYLVMEYAECGALSAATDGTPSKYSFPDILSILKQSVNALNCIHSKGIVHQDIKPSNILLCKSGKILIADFGIGHRFQSAQMVIGSPAYQAPEVLDDNGYFEEEEEEKSFHEEDYDAPTKEDVWALGVTLYQLLFGKLPYVGENLYEVVNAIKTTELQIPETCDKEVELLIRKMLTIDPRSRISMTDLAKESVVMSAADIVHNPTPANEPLLEEKPILEIKVTEMSSVDSLSSLLPPVPHAFESTGNDSHIIPFRQLTRTTNCSFD